MEKHYSFFSDHISRRHHSKFQKEHISWCSFLCIEQTGLGKLFKLKKFEQTKKNIHLDLSLNIRYPKLILNTNIKSAKLFYQILSCVIQKYNVNSNLFHDPKQTSIEHGINSLQQIHFRITHMVPGFTIDENTAD